MRTLLVATLIAASLTLVATPAAADVVSAGAGGACYADGDGASDDAGASLDADGLPPHAVWYPDDGAAQDAVAACATHAAEDGETPDGGSHLSADASAADGTVQAQATTVPATEHATGQDDQLHSHALAQGACHADGDGASDDAGASLDVGGTLPPHAVHYPDTGAAQDAVAACATQLAEDGETPDGGSHLSADLVVADGTASAGVSTVPATDALP